MSLALAAKVWVARCLKKRICAFAPTMDVEWYCMKLVTCRQCELTFPATEMEWIGDDLLCWYCTGEALNVKREPEVKSSRWGVSLLREALDGVARYDAPLEK